MKKSHAREQHLKLNIQLRERINDLDKERKKWIREKNSALKANFRTNIYIKIGNLKATLSQIESIELDYLFQE